MITLECKDFGQKTGLGNKEFPLAWDYEIGSRQLIDLSPVQSGQYPK